MEITITHKECSQRLDKFLLKYLNTAPKSLIYKMLRKRVIKLNKKKAQGGEILQEQDIVQIFLSEEKLADLREIKMPKSVKQSFGIIYEDDFVCIVNKPAGQLSHPESSADRDTLSQQIAAYLGENSGICNRLDRNTSGIIVCGKTIPALQQINKAFKERNADRYYITLVAKEITKSETLSGYLLKDSAANRVEMLNSPGDDIKSTEVITKITPIKSNSGYTLLEVKLETGKPHQIRAHLASIGAPVVGDPKYGSKEVNEYFKRRFGLSSQYLHAYKIKFNNFEQPLEYLNGKQFVCGVPKKLEHIEMQILKNGGCK